jgi:putative OPT family oligopeptide transporter
VDFQFVPVVRTLAERAKMVLAFDAVGFILGLGYVMGIRSSMILVAGGVVSNLVLVPLIWMVGRENPTLVVYPASKAIALMSATEIFRGYVRYVGVGAIATAGIFGIIKSLRVVAGSFAIAARAFKGGDAVALERTDRDIPLMAMLAGVVVSALAAALFFAKLPDTTGLVVVVGLTLTLLFSFFFTSVAANAIATTARNPVSGMTMLTIIITSVALLQLGFSGRAAMFFVMAIAGMVCTALSVSGQTITDFKTGYWLGSTPARQEAVKMIGVVVSAVAAALTIAMLARTFQFGEAAPGNTAPVLASPQASIMKALVEGFMTRQPVPYLLFGAGAMLAVAMEMLKVPALTFALGMYLPLELNSPALVGGFIAWLVEGRSTRIGGERGATIRERGIIIASGLMAGGALGGVAGAGLRMFSWFREDLLATPFYALEAPSQLLSAALFTVLCIYLWVGANRRHRPARTG